jgi:antitoxin component YwqK of YwqJK toxin-antitoxin module
MKKPIYIIFVSFQLCCFWGCKKVVKEYYPSGSIHYETTVDGDDKPNGLYKVYGKNGQLLREMYFVHGKENGIRKEYFENGKLKFEAEIVNGKTNGVLKEFLESGILKGTSEFKNGIQDGETKEYFLNGKLELQEQFKNGLTDGDYKSYYENGKIKMDAIYEKDTVIYYCKQDEAGGYKDLYRKILIVPDKNTIKVSEEYIARISIKGPLERYVNCRLLVQCENISEDKTQHPDHFFTLLKLTNGKVNTYSFTKNSADGHIISSEQSHVMFDILSKNGTFTFSYKPPIAGHYVFIGQVEPIEKITPSGMEEIGEQHKFYLTFDVIDSVIKS